MKKEEIKNFIGEIGDLPTLPTLYIALREKLNDALSSASDIAKILSSDQAICSNILRIANSSFYGLSGRITTIPHAIVVSGFNGIHHLVLNTPVAQMFTEHAVNGFNLSSLWEHSLAVAAIARIIGRCTGYTSQEEIFTAGLLHDIGKIIIYKYRPDDFSRIIHEVKGGGIFIKDAEEKYLGVDHTDIGTCLLETWNFPQLLIRTTAYHHNPVLAKEKIKAASIVHFADIIARALEIGSGGDDTIPSFLEDANQALGLTTGDIDEIIEKIDPELKNSRVFSELIK